MTKIANDWTRVRAMQEDPNAKELRERYFLNAREYLYSYNFNWLGIPIIQHPADMMAMQEIVWQTKPDLIVETGVAHGGSLVFWASLLQILGGDGVVLGIDIEVKPHNRANIEAHPLSPRIKILEGSSLEEDTVRKTAELASGYGRVMVVLDSHHSHDHVYAELLKYSPLVTKGCYLVVCDSRVEDMPDELFEGKDWGKGNNPKTAVWQFLKENDRFQIDEELEQRIFLTGNPDGYLRCVKD